MSTFRHPVGPRPSRVYWRRRLIVALGLLAVVVIVVLIIVRPSAGAPSNNPSDSGSASETPTSGETDPDDQEAGLACDPSKVTVQAVTDATSYDPGVNPLLTFTLQSTMTVPCTVPAGTDVQEYRITSGEELIWSSTHCQTDPVAVEALLMPGVPQSPASIPWDRTRSSADTCDQVRTEVIAGGASYHLSITVGEFESAQSKQFLLY